MLDPFCRLDIYTPPMKQTPTQLQSKILTRYAENKRSLPWRDSFDPYRVYISETMSQQTQVDRVVPKFHNFIQQVPDFASLATLDTPKLLSLRSGLWFNSRALRLRDAAKKIVDIYGWVVPTDRAELESLPGVWPYMSASFLAFAHDMDVPVVDTNIRRVYIHELWLDEKITRAELERICMEYLPHGQSNDWHNALMDYGALVATARATGIRPISKQSKFKWSDREVRGWVLKQLNKNNTVTIDDISKQFPSKDVKKIVKSLKKDGFVRIEAENVYIVE